MYASGILLNELAKKHSLHVTSACTVTNAEKNLPGWQAIVDEGFVDIANHSYTHIKVDDEANISSARLYHEVVDSKEYLEAAFGANQICFVAPENATTKEEIALIKKSGYYAMRRGVRGLSSLSPGWGDAPSQWLNLAMRGSHDVESVDARNAWVDEAVESHSWLIEMWHNVYDAEPYGFQPMSKNDADSHMAYIANKVAEESCWSASFIEATKYLHEKAHARVNAEIEGCHIIVRVTYIDDFLPPHVFDYPLTVCVNIPDAYSHADARIGMRKVKSILRNTQNGKAILVDIVPEVETAIITCY